MWTFSSINSLRKKFCQLTFISRTSSPELGLPNHHILHNKILLHYDGAISIQVTSDSQMANTIMHLPTFNNILNS